MFSLSENKIVLGLILVLFGGAYLAMEAQSEGFVNDSIASASE